ncbi:MAG: hypothetical protein J7599_13405 [Niabella sp.]|nr:hypothetical protein [Niabella sp.]
MKRTLLLIIAAILVHPAIAQTVIINSDGTHSVVIDNGATKTVVNPNGTHSTIINNGNTQTIVNPDGTHSTVINNGTTKTIVKPNGTHSTIINNGNTQTIVNPDGTHSTVIDNGTTKTIVKPNGAISGNGNTQALNTRRSVTVTYKKATISANARANTIRSTSGKPAANHNNRAKVATVTRKKSA